MSKSFSRYLCVVCASCVFAIAVWLVCCRVLRGCCDCVVDHVGRLGRNSILCEIG